MMYLRLLALDHHRHAGLFYISTFIDLSDKIFKGTATTALLLEFLLWATPQFLYYIIALAVLMAAVVTIGALTKTSELIVMRACGISLYRTALPLLVSALAGLARCSSVSRSSCSVRPTARPPSSSTSSAAGRRRPSTCSTGSG